MNSSRSGWTPSIRFSQGPRLMMCDVCCAIVVDDPRDESRTLERHEAWHEALEQRIVDLHEAALRLAVWTQHHPECARSFTTAESCSCGLQQAWEALDG